MINVVRKATKKTTSNIQQAEADIDDACGEVKAKFIGDLSPLIYYE